MSTMSTMAVVAVVSRGMSCAAGESREVAAARVGDFAALLSTLSTKDASAGGPGTARVETASWVRETTVVSTVSSVAVATKSTSWASST